MSNLDLTNADPRLLARLAAYTGGGAAAGPSGGPRGLGSLGGTPGGAFSVGGRTGGLAGLTDLAGGSAGNSIVSPGANPAGPSIIPGRGPVSMPMAMPGPPGGGFNRYREMTLEELLLENRVVFLIGEINHVSASNLIMRMLYLQSVKKDQDINLYINSPGGVVDDTLAIYDIMRFLTCDIATYCLGRAESGGAVVFMAGKKGKRYILPNAKVMIHQPFGGVYGQAADIEIQAEEILKTKDTLINVMAHCTGQSPERVREDSERDRFFDAPSAVKYGICDEVLGEDSSAATAVAAADATKPKE